LLLSFSLHRFRLRQPSHTLFDQVPFAFIARQTSLVVVILILYNLDSLSKDIIVVRLLNGYEVLSTNICATSFSLHAPTVVLYIFRIAPLHLITSPENGLHTQETLSPTLNFVILSLSF